MCINISAPPCVSPPLQCLQGRFEVAGGGSTHNQGPSIADSPLLHTVPLVSAKQRQQLMSVHTGALKAPRTKNNLRWKWRRRKKLNEKAESVKVCKEKRKAIKKSKGEREKQVDLSWRRVRRMKGFCKYLIEVKHKF